MAPALLTKRYGPETPPTPITVSSILALNLVETDDPFAYLLVALRNDIYEDNHGLRVAGKVFAAILALAMAGSLLCFTFRLLFRSDRSFYKLVPTPRGSFIMPNVIQCWLLANIFYTILALPFAWRAVLIEGGSIQSQPIWIALVWIAIFVGVWHVAWGTAVAALLQASRLTSADGQTSVMGAHVWAPPVLVNLYFITVILTAVGVMAGTSGGETSDWNRGAGAWAVLHENLVLAFQENAGAAGDAGAVLARIPQADRWLDTMAHSFWRFQMPWAVCLTFSAVAAVTMTLACLLQIYSLAGQIRSINNEVRSSKRASINAPPSSLTSTTMSNLDRKTGLRKVLVNVILTSVALTLSCFGYLASCLAGQAEGNKTPLFHRFLGWKSHLYIIVMVYSSISLVVVLLILRQTFDPTVLQTKASSQARRSSQQPLNGPRSPSSDFTTNKIISPGVMSPATGTDRGSTFRAAQDYELAQTGRTSAGPASGFASPVGQGQGMGVGREYYGSSPAGTAEGGGAEVLESGGGSSVGHGQGWGQGGAQGVPQQHEWRMNGSRRPVPEL